MATGQPKNDYYVVKSLRDGDMFNRSLCQYECNYIFSRQNDKKLYDTICYSDGKVSIRELDEGIREKLAQSVTGIPLDENSL